ncbi:hypothetical protein [Plantactinospora sp. CA-290183]|uniref:hypothetical protein n=1 Tax=Plantactinospora sp. CA-290183 TaxID=3240006 RepID=UPI003D8DBE7E
MGLWNRWRTRRTDQLAREQAAREQDAAEAAAARQRLLDQARRLNPGQYQPSWNEPTRIEGLPLITYGQRNQYQIQDFRRDGSRWLRVPGPTA